MKGKYSIFAALFALSALCSCDDGRIEENMKGDEEGMVCKAEGWLSGVDAEWPEGYTLALAGFTHEDDYAAISKAIAPNTSSEGWLSMEMSGIPANVEQVELCVLNRLRQRVATFQTLRTDGIRDTLFVSFDHIDASPLKAIQTNLLDASCIACHGASGFKGAGLDLTDGHFYEATVGKPSQKVEGKYIVQPGNAQESVLSLVLGTDISSSWRQNHADMLNRERTANLLQFVDRWIDRLENSDK